MKRYKTPIIIIFIFAPIFLFIGYMLRSYTMLKNSKKKEEEKTQFLNSDRKKNISNENKKNCVKKDKRSNEEKFSSYVC